MASPFSVRVAERERQRLFLQDLPSQVAELNRRVSALDGQFAQFRVEVKEEFSAVRTEMAPMRQDMKDGDEETRRYMRMLHEDIVERIKTLQHG